MIQTGKVIKVSGDKLHVCFERPEMCQHCGACDRKKESLVTLFGSAHVGDTVIVDMPEGQLLKTSIFTYLIPIAGLLLGLWLGGKWLPSEQGAALVGFITLVLSLGFVIAYDRFLGKNKRKLPAIIDVIPCKEDMKNE